MSEAASRGGGPRPLIVAVVGPTGTGKSALGIALARQLDGEVVNCDSMQLYRGMDIGTAKLNEAEREGVAHHLLDIWDISTPANVADYQRRAREVFDDIHSRGRLPILVGGSGLYVRAALDDLQFPGHDPHVRAQLNAELAQLGPHVLHDRLAQVDPEAAAAILPTNGRRIVRALEVVALTGGTFQAELPTPTAFYPSVQIGLRLPRPELDAALDARVQRMWERGLVAEVAALAGLRESPTARFALGYRQVLEYLDGELTEAEAQAATARGTRKFARRQESWFGRDPRVQWLDADAPDLIEGAQRLVAQARNA